MRSQLWMPEIDIYYRLSRNVTLSIRLFYFSKDDSSASIRGHCDTCPVRVDYTGQVSDRKEKNKLSTRRR